MLNDKMIRALRWIDTVPHHSGEWLPRYAAPEDVTKFRINGRWRWITIDKATWEALAEYIGISAKEDRLFELTEDGKAALSATGGGDE